MPIFHANHLIIDGRTTPYPYTSKARGRSIEVRPGLNRVTHGNDIRRQLNAAVANFQQSQDDLFVYVVFKSPVDFLLDLKKLEDSKGDFRLRTTRQLELQDQEGTIHHFSEATVYLNRRAVSKFLRKADEYINRNTSGGRPRHQSLIANIDEIRAATLQSFWQEPELHFPESIEQVWWEIWISKSATDLGQDPISSLRPLLTEHEVQIGQRFLVFPEHYIYLMKATAEQLSNSILYTDRLCEIRMPRGYS